MAAPPLSFSMPAPSLSMAAPSLPVAAPSLSVAAPSLSLDGSSLSMAAPSRWLLPPSRWLLPPSRKRTAWSFVLCAATSEHMAASTHARGSNGGCGAPPGHQLIRMGFLLNALVLLISGCGRSKHPRGSAPGGARCCRNRKKVGWPIASQRRADLWSSRRPDSGGARYAVATTRESLRKGCLQSARACKGIRQHDFNGEELLHLPTGVFA